MANKQGLREIAEAAGGEYVRAAGNGCYVRWPSNTGGEVRFETRASLVAAEEELEVYDTMYDQATRRWKC